MTHPIIDLTIRIKNGYQAHKDAIVSPYSIFREKVIKKLKDIGYVKSYTVTGDTVKKMEIELQYDEASSPAVTDVRLYSKPGRRWYINSKQIKPVLGGMGYSLISTSQGVMTHVEAKKKHLGGELLFSIW